MPFFFFIARIEISQHVVPVSTQPTMASLCKPWKLPPGERHADCDYEHLYIAAIGNAAVGKTCFLYRLLNDAYDAKRVSTVSVDYQDKYLLAGPDQETQTRVTLMDTIGDDRAWFACAAHMKRAVALFVCFDSTLKSSYERCAEWIRLLRKENEHAACLLVALKADLYEKLPDGQKWMSDFDMQKEARLLGCSIGFCMVSSMMNTGVKEALSLIVNAAVEAEQALAAEVHGSAKKRSSGAVNIAEPARLTAPKKGCCKE